VRYQAANIESSEVWGTYCLLNKLIYFIDCQFICGKCPKPPKIQYSLPDSLRGPIYLKTSDIYLTVPRKTIFKYADEANLLLPL